MMFLAGNLGLRFRFAWMSPIVLQLGIVLQLVTLWIGGQWWYPPACHGTCLWVVICFAAFAKASDDTVGRRHEGEHSMWEQMCDLVSVQWL